MKELLIQELKRAEKTIALIKQQNESEVRKLKEQMSYYKIVAFISVLGIALSFVALYSISTK